MVAHGLLGSGLFYSGDLPPAREHLERAIALYDPHYHRTHPSILGPEGGVVLLSTVASVLLFLGYPDTGAARSREALRLARERSNPASLAFALSFAAVFHQYRGEVHATLEHAEAAIAISDEHGFPDWVLTGTFLRGWAMGMQAQMEQGTEQMRQVLDVWRAAGVGLLVPWGLAWLAETYGHARQPRAGLALLAETTDATNEAMPILAYICRLKGDLLLAASKDNDAEAETCFRQAIDVARRQRTKYLELRAAASLSRLWQKQGKKDEARELLAEIYGWSTQGFDAPRLKEAKALLDELS